jgi:ABC-type Mn2+/Zn2+ transport system ATPase subunit
VSDPFLPYGSRRHADPVPGEPALLARSVCAGYPGMAGLAVRGVSLRVPAGSRVALVGPNGAGKSTLLKAIAGHLPLRSGDTSVHGNPVGACHHRVAYLPQRGDVDWRFPINVRRLVTTGRYVHLGWLGRPRRKDRQIVAEVMDGLGLSALAERQIGELSGGQQQWALLARALVQGADLLLLDEPMTAVDARTRAAISEVLADLGGRGKTIVIATHDLASLSSEFDGALYLREGREVEPEPGSFTGIPVGREAPWSG